MNLLSLALLSAQLRQVLHEEIVENYLPYIGGIFHFYQVACEKLKHLIVVLPKEVCDGDAVLEVTCIRLHLIIYNNHVFQATAVEQDHQILHVHAVFKDIEALLPGENVIEELMTSEGLKHHVRVLLLGSCEENKFVVLL